MIRKKTTASALTTKSRTKSASLSMPSNYAPFLENLKARIRAAQVKAVLSVNREMITLYWHIGKSIVERQRIEGWGKAVVERLSRDIQNEFPGIRGYSPQNIWYMRSFFLAWTDDVINLQQAAGDSGRAILQQAVGELDGRNLPQLVAEIPWGQNILLLEKLKDPTTRLWYARKTIEHGWSRAVLVHQIESDLHKRQGRAVSNFTLTLPPPQSDLAQQALKDPYIFDFLNIGEKARERAIEQGLLDHVQRFLLELGVGFAFVGRQVHLEVDDEDFYIDLLFYHVRMHCYVVLELKAGVFKPEHAGKMNFYLAAVDDKLRTAGDNPSIGIILCKTRKKLIAEYALKNTRTPIGVSQYELTRSIPKELRSGLPSIEELEKELSDKK